MKVHPYHLNVSTPLGEWILLATPRGLKAVLFEKENLPSQSISMSTHPSDHHPAQKHLLQASRELMEYFAHQRQTFEVPLDISGTAFQIDVLRALLKVPFGRFVTYQELAEQVNHPRATRAVGQVMKFNPLPIFIPCHRVLSKDGLGGYSGGLVIKEHVLNLEGIRAFKAKPSTKKM